MLTKLSLYLLLVLSVEKSYALTGKVLKNDVYITGIKSYDFEDVCKTLTGKVYPLIEAEGINSIDCMSEVVSTNKFCLMKNKNNPYVIKGIIKNGKVDCIMGKKVIFKYECPSISINEDYEGVDLDLCYDKNYACEHIKHKFASRLSLSHASLTTFKSGLTRNHAYKVLSCYFSYDDLESSIKYL